MHYTLLVQWISMIPVFFLGIVCGEKLVARIDQNFLCNCGVVSLIIWLGLLVVGFVQLVTSPPTPWHMAALFVFMIVSVFVDRTFFDRTLASQSSASVPDFERLKAAGDMTRKYDSEMEDVCTNLAVFNLMVQAEAAVRDVFDPAVRRELSCAVQERDQMTLCFQRNDRRAAYYHAGQVKARVSKLHRSIFISELLDAQEARSKG